MADPDEADDDDEGQGEELGCSEEVLHSGGGLHAVAVHEGQQHCGKTQTQKPLEGPTKGAGTFKAPQPGREHNEALFTHTRSTDTHLRSAETIGLGASDPQVVMWLGH